MGEETTRLGCGAKRCGGSARGCQTGRCGAPTPVGCTKAAYHLGVGVSPPLCWKPKPI
ncbi:MAG: hypothetical protein QW453_05840 [Thermoprotei archaeon]